MSNPGLIESAYRILWKRKQVYSLEIWKGEEEQYFVFSEKRGGFQELLLRLSAVYPAPRMEISPVPLPERECFVSAGFLRLDGALYSLKSLDDLGHDPLVHVMAATPGNTLIQFLFRPERIVVERLSWDSPVYRCRVAVAVFSDDWKRAVNSCEIVLRSFTVLSSPSCELVPVIPKILDSGIILKSILREGSCLLRTASASRLKSLQQ